MSEFKYDVFVSYKTEEEVFARKVYEVLKDKYNVFFSVNTLHQEGSDDFSETITTALLSSMMLLNVGTSTEWLSGNWLIKERDYFAPLRDDSNGKRKIYNVVDENISIPDDLPEDIKRWETFVFPQGEERLIERIDNVKNFNITAVMDFAWTNMPEELNSEQYERNIFRQTSFHILNEYFSDLKENKGLLYIYGAAGVGKTSFMSKSFIAYEDVSYKKYIYYVKGNDSINEHLDKISNALSENFTAIAREHDLHVEFDDILSLPSASNKIDKLLYSYSKEIYSRTNIEFIVFIDAVDTLKEENKFIHSLIKNHKGIHFVFSGRIPPSEDFFIQLKEDARQLDIFKQENNIGLKLENLEDNLTLKYLDSNLEVKNVLSNNEQKTIKAKILEKSKGLPKYFELLLAKVNKLAFEEQEDTFKMMVEEIDSAPEELMDYYGQILKSIKKENALAIQILEKLYWYNDTGIKKQTLIDLLEVKDPKEFYEALNVVEYLIKIKNEDMILLNHLSISEALFIFDAKDIHGNLSARKLDRGYMQEVFEKIPILLSLAKHNNDIYTLLSDVYYFNENNRLFQSLDKIVTFYLNKPFLKNDDPIDLYFSYSKILFAQNMLKTDILHENISALDLFAKADVSLSKIVSFNEKVYQQYYSVHEFENVYELRKLVVMTVLDQNSYYQAKYLKKYLVYKYGEKYKMIFASEQLSKMDMDGLLSNLSRTYVAMRYKLSGKPIDSKLGIHEDNGAVMIYNETKGTNPYVKIFDTIKNAQSQRRKQQRGLLEKQQRYYNIIETSSSVKLKKHFYNSVYHFMKQKNKLDTAAKDFLSNVAVDVLFNDIKTFNREDNFYRFLPQEKKQEINRILSFYKSYQDNGLSSLLKNKNLDYFDRIATFIKSEDVKEFLSYADSIIEEGNRRRFFGIVAQNIRHTDDENSLLTAKGYLKEFQDSVGDAPLMLTMLVYYKLNDLEGLKKLEKWVVKQEYSREERSTLQTLIGKIDNGLDKHWEVLSQRKLKGLENYLHRYFPKAKYENSELEFFKEYILADQKIYEAMVESSYTMTELDRLKYLFLFLKENNLFSNEDEKVFALNILLLRNVDSFITMISQSSYDFQTEFLYKALTPEKKRIVFNETFFLYLMKLFFENTISDQTVKLLGSFHYHELFYDFVVKNPKIIQSLYDKISIEGSREDLTIKAMLYRNILAVKGEDAYTELKDQEWISEEMKLGIASSLIFLTEKVETALFLSEFLNADNSRELDRIKILIYIGVVFHKSEMLDEGIKALVQMKQTEGNWSTKYDNYLNFTLSHVLSEDVAQLISNIFTSYNFDHYHLQSFIDAETFSKSGTYIPELVSNPGEFATYYTLFNELDKQLEFYDFEGKLFNKNFESYMRVLIDQFQEAMLNDDVERVNHYTELFDNFKNTYIDLFKEKFENYDSITLRNYNKSKKNEVLFSLNIMETNYQTFYKYMKDLATKNNDESREKFDQIVEEIQNSEKYFELLKEKSSIPSKMFMTIEDIEYFEENL